MRDEVLIAQKEDKDIQHIIDNLGTAIAQNSFIIEADLLCKVIGYRKFEVVPKVLRYKVLYMYHDDIALVGHKGILKTIQAIQENYWWFNLKADVIKYISSCHTCQIYAKSKTKIGSLKPLFATQIMERVGIDYVGPLRQTLRTNRFILVCVDYFSRMAIVKVLTCSTAEVTANFVIEEVICKHGFPREVLSDQGPQFRSNLTKLLSSNTLTSKKANCTRQSIV